MRNLPTTEYDLLDLFDRLEELREDLQELALRGGESIDDEDEEEDIDIEELDVAALTAELSDLGLTTLDDVERRIAELNARLDEEDE